MKEVFAEKLLAAAFLSKILLEVRLVDEGDDNFFLIVILQ